MKLEKISTDIPDEEMMIYGYLGKATESSSAPISSSAKWVNNTHRFCEE